MTRIHSRNPRRPGFTLIELLVVIAIIATLIGLLLAGVMKAYGKVPEVQTRTEISQLEAALAAFMSDYQLSDPPPSVLVLHEDMNYGATAVEQQSLQFLKKTFGRTLGTGGVIDWNGDGAANGPWVLEGEQCLVFYTGGIPTVAGGVPGCLGFSTNNANPASNPLGKRNGPYMTFKTNRLKVLTNKAGTPWFVYLDAYQSDRSALGKTLGGVPYAYFSSTGNNNSGYGANGGLDCTTIGAAAYRDAAGIFMNSNKYQIISAGADGQFTGTAGVWNPASGATGVDADNQANFSAKLLVAGQQ
jgi:general secretion pathway protein G